MPNDAFSDFILRKYNLTNDEVLWLRRVRDGADVIYYEYVVALRQLHTAFPTLIDVCEPMGTYGPFEVRPYLGVVATAEGLALLDQLDRRAAARDVSLPIALRQLADALERAPASTSERLVSTASRLLELSDEYDEIEIDTTFVIVVLDILGGTDATQSLADMLLLGE